MQPKADNIRQYLPMPLPKQRYYTLQEVTKHNTANDCWVILFNEVYDLTRTIQNNIKSTQQLMIGSQTQPLIHAAGTDITFWFDTLTRQPRKSVNTTTASIEFYCPNGKYLHLGEQLEIKWWKDMKNIIGKLTKKSRKIRLLNMITDHNTILEVPSQQTINEILTRYKFYNKHGGSYTWKRLGRPLDMTKTLTENGIQDEDGQFDRLGIPQCSWYIPTIHLFFNDDLTVA